MTERDSPAKVATEQLFEQYGNEIRKYARYMLGGWNEADDAMQEIFLRVFKSWHKYSGQSRRRGGHLRQPRSCRPRMGGRPGMWCTNTESR
ncbi:sigma-70 family RNA polymerase sigma factor [Alicyclobacillus contaminans]|uniref:RNA polymerase sigma factor n=1 Tax=Alicyclobacillus contaminans TaxID=392016 RepID=UPI000A00A88B